MKKTLIILLLFFFVSSLSFSQQIDYNIEKGYVANGYDVVAYFSNKALKGNSNYKFKYNNANYRFTSKTNLEKFKANPEKYIPQYGGWCAYAMADKGEKVTINPKTFEIRDGKLYLFYNKFFTNTFESWLEEKPRELIKKADKNWEEIRFKS